MVDTHLQIWPWVKISIKYILILNFTKFQMNPAHMDLSGDLWERGIKKIWNPSTKSMESIPHSMDSILKKYGVHPQFHGFHLEFLESTPHSMDSIWIIPGRVKYSYTTASVVSQTPPWVAECGGVDRNGIGGCGTWVGRSLYTEFHFHNIWK